MLENCASWMPDQYNNCKVKTCIGHIEPSFITVSFSQGPSFCLDISSGESLTSSDISYIDQIMSDC